MAHRRKKVSHGREAFYIACILIFVLIGIFIVFGPEGYLEMKRIQVEFETHRKRNEAIADTNDKIKQEIQGMRDDPQVQEDYLRRKGYARKGEIILEVPEPAPDKPLPANPASPAQRK
jgi:cell division protein FtsB